jgi:hypothetical protein
MTLRQMLVLGLTLIREVLVVLHHLITQIKK